MKDFRRRNSADGNRETRRRDGQKHRISNPWRAHENTGCRGPGQREAHPCEPRRRGSWQGPVLWHRLAALDLRNVKGLEQLRHHGPSTVGIDTLHRSAGAIPDAFLRGCGVPDAMIEYAQSLARSETSSSSRHSSATRARTPASPSASTRIFKPTVCGAGSIPRTCCRAKRFTIRSTMPSGVRTSWCSYSRSTACKARGS
jgi:hypothetical protein